MSCQEYSDQEDNEEETVASSKNDQKLVNTVSELLSDIQTSFRKEFYTPLLGKCSSLDMGIFIFGKNYSEKEEIEKD